MTFVMFICPTALFMFDQKSNLELGEEEIKLARSIENIAKNAAICKQNKERRKNHTINEKNY